MAVEYIRNRTARGIEKLERRMESDVREICERVLIPFTEEVGRHDFPEDKLMRLRGYFRDIYWSLKMHLLFHSRNADVPQEIDKLHEVGAWGGLTDEAMNSLPNLEQVVDPGSKLVEMVST